MSQWEIILKAEAELSRHSGNILKNIVWKGGRVFLTLFETGKNVYKSYQKLFFWVGVKRQ